MATLKASPVFLLGAWSLITSTLAFSTPRNASVSRMSPWFGFLVGLGLVLGSVGDFALEVELVNPKFFIVGLGAFLAGHVFYIIAFMVTGVSTNTVGMVGVTVPVLGFCVSLIAYLVPKIDKPELHVPVVVYAATIGVMAITSVLWRGEQTILKDRSAGNSADPARAASKAYLAQLTSYAWVAALVGSLLFVVSDSILALNKFAHPFPQARLYTMLTYYTAQTAIEASAYLMLRADERVVAVDTVAKLK